MSVQKEFATTGNTFRLVFFVRSVRLEAVGSGALNTFVEFSVCISKFNGDVTDSFFSVFYSLKRKKYKMKK
jgi:hypothetical protein